MEWRNTKVDLLIMNAVEPEGSDNCRLPKEGPEVAGLEVEKATAAPGRQYESQKAMTVVRRCLSEVLQRPVTVVRLWRKGPAEIEADQERFEEENRT